MKKITIQDLLYKMIFLYITEDKAIDFDMEDEETGETILSLRDDSVKDDETDSWIEIIMVNGYNEDLGCVVSMGDITEEVRNNDQLLEDTILKKIDFILEEADYYNVEKNTNIVLENKEYKNYLFENFPTIIEVDFLKKFL